MALRNNESDDDIFADNLSNYSCDSDEELINNISDDSSGSDVVRVRRNMRVFPLQYSDDDEDDNEEIGEEWSEIDRPPPIEPFLDHPGLNIFPNNRDSIIDSMNLFIGEDLFKMMEEETNRYHSQNFEKFKVYKKSRKWKDVTVCELKNFFGLIILMGQIPKSTINEFWSTDPLLETLIFSKVMSRDRFRQIWQSWHFCNNEMIDQSSDRLFKIQPLRDYLVGKFKTVYTPKREISLDESIIPWRGRLGFRVYNASKIIKYGILVRMACEATSGYICNLEIYCRQGKTLLETIKSVMSPYLNKWYHLYMDNYYNSVTVSEKLLEYKIRTCGTIRINRGLPDSLKNKKLKKGESIFRRKKDTLLQIWQSKREVRMISNIHSAQILESRNVDWHTRTKIMKPESVIEYNKFMKGVDRADQYLSYYSILRKTRKWTKRTAMYLLNCALFNSFRVHNLYNNTSMGYKKFLLEVSRKLITDDVPAESIDDEQPGTSTAVQRARAPNFDPPGRLSFDMKKHKIVKIESKGKKKHAQRQCRVCAAKKKKSSTCYKCVFCDIPLHRGSCYHQYHTLKHF